MSSSNTKIETISLYHHIINGDILHQANTDFFSLFIGHYSGGGQYFKNNITVLKRIYCNTCRRIHR